MFAKPIQSLIEFFLKFPGVGPRQAARFAFYLLREDPVHVETLAEAIARLPSEVRFCQQCYKTFDVNHNSAAGNPGLCEFCRDPRRDQRQILVVEKEADLENIERTRKYGGLYHVLGGVIDPLDSSAPAKLHIKELFERVKGLARDGSEVEAILATNPTAEGDATALYLERVISPLKGHHSGFRLSRLGRGLTTGSELEYSDEITIANALQNRK
ncbi:MAG: recombination protein RecR [Candidatus Sungbacteria bacterium]|uniref:Recombination protein RecR n=1 Tax=Candidatus Sungiibacteriota bacterium TaxID=2750080 RepID=A0A932YYQ1_9BACT|nr:recombination protein RecR [Candidatus Sungbacteria bacterium]